VEVVAVGASGWVPVGRGAGAASVPARHQCRRGISAGGSFCRGEPARRCLAGLICWRPGEIELRGRVGGPQDLFMVVTAAVLSLTVAARLVRGQQQRRRGWGPISGRL
jgi:hypothetical protein